MPIKFLASLLICFSSLFASYQAIAVDIYNTLRNLYIADQTEPFFEVISLSKSESIDRVPIDYMADQLVVSPNAPLLVYANIAQRKLVIYHLRERLVAAEITLDFDPRHMVLDTTGLFIGISDSLEGGFALVSLAGYSLDIHLPNFAKTADVLFDPNGTDLYFSNNETGSIGILDMNRQRVYDMPLVDMGENPVIDLSPPSRSLDGRYIYISESHSGDIYSLNAYSRVIYQTFNIGAAPARPYSTPEGIFLYLLDTETGRFKSFQQHNFSAFSDTGIGPGIDMVSTGRFDRMNLFASSINKNWYLFDNTQNKVVAAGEFKGVPIDVQGSVDGKTVYVAFQDIAEIAAVQMEKQKISYIATASNGARSFSLVTNNVCH